MGIKRDRQEKLRLVRRYNPFLESGKYLFDASFRVFVKVDQLDQPMLKDWHFDQEKILEIPGSESEFKGSILWFCMSGDIKIFSDNHVLTLCQNQENYDMKLTNYKYFSTYFPLPKIIHQSDNQQQFVEERIVSDQCDLDKTKLQARIYQDYYQYFQKLMKNQTLSYRSVQQMLDNATIDWSPWIEPSIQSIPKSLQEMKFPKVKLHGDLWTANIIVDKQDIWYINWDESDDYLFFYDFFKMMWNEADVHGEHGYLDTYLARDWHADFTKIFKLFNLNFETEHRLAYFYLFFLNFLLESNLPIEVKKLEWTDFQRKISALYNISTHK